MESVNDAKSGTTPGARPRRKAGSRRKGRELALQALYQIEANGDAWEDALELFWESASAGAAALEFARGLVVEVRARREEIDRVIAEVSRHWRLERLSRVDLCAIRVAICELIPPRELPVEIAINEAVEVARKFGAGETAAFVNGVLDAAAVLLGRKEGGHPRTQGRRFSTGR